MHGGCMPSPMLPYWATTRSRQKSLTPILASNTLSFHLDVAPHADLGNAPRPAGGLGVVGAARRAGAAGAPVADLRDARSQPQRHPPPPRPARRRQPRRGACVCVCGCFACACRVCVFVCCCCTCAWWEQLAVARV
eukprot:3101122-Rhodomonas_salina.1